MRSFLSCLSVLSLLIGCGGEIGPQGPAGAAGEPCTVVDNGGSATITCPGSDPVTVFSGIDGEDGDDGINGVNGEKGNNGTNGTDGTNGTNGTNGHSTLATANDEPAGDNCQFGGTKISMGLDNGDGGGKLTMAFYKAAKSIRFIMFVMVMAVMPNSRWVNFV